MLKYTIKDLKADEYNQKHYKKLLKKLENAGIVRIEHSGFDCYDNELRRFDPKYNDPGDRFDGSNSAWENMYRLTPNQQKIWNKYLKTLLSDLETDFLPNISQKIWNGDIEFDHGDNSYNGSFLGDDFTTKWNEDDPDKIYIAWHNAGDIRGNYTDYCIINRDQLYDLMYIKLNIDLIDKNGNIVATYYNEQSNDMPYYRADNDDDPLDLSDDELEDLDNLLA